jgi:hypothetical protein
MSDNDAAAIPIKWCDTTQKPSYDRTRPSKMQALRGEWLVPPLQPRCHDRVSAA